MMSRLKFWGMAFVLSLFMHLNASNAQTCLPDAIPNFPCNPISELPTLCITTCNANAVDSKETYRGAEMVIVEGIETTQILYEGDIRIRGRGNSTWLMDKKPFRLNLNTAASLLGMPSVARNWVLLANYADKSLIRNAMALDLSAKVGMPYASPFRFVDVVLNGVYQGTYLLTDHMEVRENRIDIEEGQNESVPGAFLVELDGFAWQESAHIRTTNGLIASVKYPENTAYWNPVTEFINEFESRLFSGKRGDEVGGYAEMVDMSSLVNWYIVCELTGNTDSFWSVYIHKRRSDGKFYFGPHWDFDIAFNNDSRFQNASFKLMADVAHDYIFRKWIIEFRKDVYFMELVKARWNELKTDGLKDYLLNKSDQYSTLLTISGAQQQNFLRWDVLNTPVYREVFTQGSYQEHVHFLATYIANRYDWLDQELNGFSDQMSYWLINVSSGRYLAASGNSFQLYNSSTGQPQEKWRFKREPGGASIIINQATQEAIAKVNDAPEGIALTNPTATPSNLWRISQIGSDQYVMLDQHRELGVQVNNGTLGTYWFNEVDEYTNKNVWLDVTTLGKWRIVPTGEALPIAISNFTARLLERQVELSWQITEVVGGSHIEIERLDDNGTFITLSKSALELGHSSRYIDISPASGLNIYRLKLVDLDGSFSYSSLVSIWNTDQARVALFPNPTHSELHIEHSFYNAPYVTVAIRAVDGTLIRECELPTKDRHLNSLSVDYLNPGMYFLGIKSNSQWVYYRFIKR